MASWLDRYRNPITIVLAALLAAAVVTLVLDRGDEQALEFRRGEPTPGGPIEVRLTPLTHVFFGVGSGYGSDQDWRHGMYQGELVVQGLTLDMNEDKDKLFGLTDQMARFELGDDVGYGLHEYSLMGAHDKYGFKSFDDVAP